MHIRKPKVNTKNTINSHKNDAKLARNLFLYQKNHFLSVKIWTSQIKVVTLHAIFRDSNEQ